VSRYQRTKVGGGWVADSERVTLLHEPAHYPVAFVPRDDVRGGVLEPSGKVTEHRDVGVTEWFTAVSGDARAERSAWAHVDLPAWAGALDGHVAFAWRIMEAFFGDERIVGHATDLYHRNDIRQTLRHLVVRDGDRVVADTRRPPALYESGFAPRWYEPRGGVTPGALEPGQAVIPHGVDRGLDADEIWSR
jgi:uncharacterized protein (DUF427 family)